ncbi:hypothetical protein COMA2_130092 [Candidatus Nitrospira nitrificans]|uniref:Uncharacterized protein n=1 Tax=Candidatus Nitrospira nitrificans TaxID=1742973 RepID=A0A0S4L714_9BACT|nr:hypothetical protein COMA2_130092 [Candidatus Nitrospira nitrificans]
MGWFSLVLLRMVGRCRTATIDHHGLHLKKSSGDRFERARGMITFWHSFALWNTGEQEPVSL